MRILVWGINYAPEQTGIGPYNTALCEFLAQRGHDVAMVAAFEYYPAWEKRPEDKGHLYRDEVRSGVTVHRCWLYVPKKVRSFKRIAHEFSFVLSSLLRVLFLKRPDVFVIVSPPLLLGLAAAVAGFFKRAPFLFHVQDLQPDAAIRLGMLKMGGAMTRALYALESFAYRFATRVSTISPGILRMMRNKQVPESKLVFFPNGVRLDTVPAAPGAFRARHGISPETFLLLYSGNLGVKQGLQVLVDAAQLLQEQSSVDARPFKIVIAGAGAMRESLAAQIAEKQLNNLLLLPLQSEEGYREMMADADCCAITQQPGTGELFFPSKLLTTLALAKPVLSIADDESDLALAVIEGQFGLNAPPGQPQEVVATLRQLALPQTDLKTLGEKGRAYVARYEQQFVLGNFEEELNRMVSPSRTNGLDSPGTAASKPIAEREASVK